jgi:hypothetical protein
VNSVAFGISVVHEGCRKKDAKLLCSFISHCIISPAQASSCSAFCRVGLKYYKMMETLIGGFEETINSVHCEVHGVKCRRGDHCSLTESLVKLSDFVTESKENSQLIALCLS